MRTRTFLATILTVAVAAACTGAADDVEVDEPGDATGALDDEDGSTSGGSDGEPTEADLTDLPPTTMETVTLDGRTLTLTTPGNVVASEPTSMGLRIVGDAFGLRIVAADGELAEIDLDDWPGDGAEVERVEERWDGEIRIAMVDDGFAAALYDDGATRLVLIADAGRSLEPVTAVDELEAALDEIEIERTERGPVIATTDPDVQRASSLTYELAGIDSDLEIVEGNELSQRLTVDPDDGPIDGAGGDVVVSNDGVIELVTDTLFARIRLVLPDDIERQRGRDLMTLLELELDS